MFDTENRRRLPRNDLHYHAFIVLGRDRRPCLVHDITNEGAFLKVEGPAEIPASFILNLTASGPPCRGCRVIWRDDNGVGVEWTGRFSRAECADKTCTLACPGFPDGAGPSGDPAGDNQMWF